MVAVDKNKRVSTANAIALGAAAIIAQVLLFRELLPVGLGNELAAGIIFAGWLAGTGAGSAAGAGLVTRRRAGSGMFAFSLAAFAVALPVCIALARVLRVMAGYSPGEVVPPGVLLWMLPLAAAPVAFFAGLAFSLLCAAPDAEAVEGVSVALSRPADVFLYESAGSIAGALIYCLLFVFIFSPMRIAGIIGVMLFGVAVVIFRRSGHVKYISIAALGVAVVFAVFFARPAEHVSRRVQWGGADVVATAESAYANITVVRDGSEQLSLFSNGRFADTLPERVSAQFMAHVPLSLCVKPRDVLLVGLGPSVAREVLKHGARSVTLVELDPVVLGMRERFSSADELAAMRDPRVSVEISDARNFIMSSGRRFDAIIVRAGEPDTLLSNRYFTREFYSGVSRALRPGGIFAMQSGFKENAMGGWQADLLGTHLRTLQSVLGRPLLVLGGQGALLISRKGARLEYGAKAAAERYRARGIKASYFSPTILFESLERTRTEQSLMQPELTGRNIGAYLAAHDKIDYVFSRLEHRPGSRVDRDFEPISLYYQQGVYSQYYNNRFSAFMKRAGGGRTAAVGWLTLFACVCAGSILVAWFKKGSRVSAIVPLAAAAGFAGMALEMILLFIIQIRSGNIYYYVGIIIASFMLGGAVGGFFGRAVIIKKPGAVRVAFVVCALSLAGLCAGVGAAAAGGGAALSSASATMAVAVAGVLVGAVFSLAAAWCGGGGRAGILYAADNVGAAAGALLTGVVFVPLIGIGTTAYLCAATVVIGLVPVVVMREKN